MKTKRILVALFTLGAYLNGNSQSFIPLNNKLYASPVTTYVGFGTSTPLSKIHLLGSDFWSSTLTIERKDNVSGGELYFKQTPTTFTTTKNNGYIGTIGWQGTSGSTIAGSASITARASEDWTSTANGIRLDFYTTKIGSTNPTISLTIDHDGSLNAIGNASLGSLDVKSFHTGNCTSSTLGYSTSYTGFNALRNNTAGTFTLTSDGTHNGGNLIYSTIGGDMVFSSIPSSATPSTSQTVTDSYVATNASLRITPSGLIAKEIQVKTSVWADYVFKKDYKLRSLQEVEKYINANSHLPEVPSESEVKEKGINVSEMNATLLKKVEELTLYMIDQNKRIELLEKQNAEFLNNLKQ